jgi:predicted CXXCH cytochrome family protein
MDALLAIAALAVLTIAAGLMWRAGAGARRQVALVLGAVVAVAAAVAFARPPAKAPPPEGTPRRDATGGYASSDACRACHPSEHASWARSFHRSMTAEGTAANVRAPLPAKVTFEGEAWTLAASAERVVVQRAGGEPEPLILTTGSHHYQAYWLPGARPGELRTFPLVWHVGEGRWLPRRDVFLQPPGAAGEAGPGARWNSNCIACHAVAGRPRHDEEANAFSTRTAELGIACEACHGPGAEHVAARRSPLARLSQNGTSDPTIVNPARLDAAAASRVCGQCHAFAYPRDESRFWTDGYAGTLRPGDPLEPSRWVLFPETFAQPDAPRIDADLGSIYWSDGTIRVGGREYNALVKSPCFERGEGERKLSCLSCHAMHASEPDDQLRRDRTTSQICSGCHAGKEGPAHTHHAVGSPAGACVACHMPKTTYALLKGIRSHRIESPSARSAVLTGRPTACNLCHLDRSIAWTAARLRDWGHPETLPVVDDAVLTLPAGARLALAGDAAARALVADAMGDPDARAAAGSDWQATLLDDLAHDDYAAVRLIAARSRAGFAPATRVLVDATTQGNLLAQRDRRAITISE